jgi:hypothetical protein
VKKKEIGNVKTLTKLLLTSSFVLTVANANAAFVQGVYRGPGASGVSDMAAYDQWLGHGVPLASDYEAQDWIDIGNPTWQTSPWGQWVASGAGRNLVLSVPMLPANTPGVSLAACASGSYDSTWTALAQNLVKDGLSSAHLRLGWEFDGDWYPWGAPPGSGLESSLAGCFRDVVLAMRAAEPGAHFSFIWNLSTRFNSDTTYLANTWPGGDVVDYVGIDLFDQSWAANTYPYPSPCDATCMLQHQKNAWASNYGFFSALDAFAVTKGKPFCVPEWGVSASANGGGDDPYFVQQMHDAMVTPANNVAFEAYFDAAGHSLSAQPYAFPSSSALFTQLFCDPQCAAPPALPAPAMPPPMMAALGGVLLVSGLAAVNRRRRMRS